MRNPVGEQPSRPLLVDHLRQHHPPFRVRAIDIEATVIAVIEQRYDGELFDVLLDLLLAPLTLEQANPKRMIIAPLFLVNGIDFRQGLIDHRTHDCFLSRVIPAKAGI